MNCKNCGNQINPNAIACLKCGCDPSKGNKHCNNCGVETNPEQIICIKCGESLKNQSLPTDEGKMVSIIAYLTLIGFIVAINKHNKNKTKIGAYHLRQVVGFIITNLIFVIAILILLMADMDNNSYVYYSFISFISFIISIILVISYISSLINAVNGIEKPALIFGKTYEKWLTNMFDENPSGIWYEPTNKIIISLLKLLTFAWENISKIFQKNK